jgi:hypothetical protein
MTKLVLKAIILCCGIIKSNYAFAPHHEYRAKFRDAPAFSCLRTFSASVNDIELTDSEGEVLRECWEQAKNDDTKLKQIIVQNLPKFSPQLLMKLKQVPQNAPVMVKSVATIMQGILDDQLSQGREVLATLLAAGELRKLDAEIGKACRAGKLDMAFFSVLDLNIKDAVAEAAIDASQDGEASRLSILRHVYTRCQEEVEKLVPPGIALLNKLLRTDQNFIRANQLQHYLCPQPNVITLPDGQEIPVKDADQKKILVPPLELVNAIISTVKQIRTVENAGGMSKEAAANMVEACRTVAKEARLVIAENYGSSSQELSTLEKELQPVFRPDSSSSEYIQGIQQ